MSKEILIKGVGVNLEHEDVKKCKNFYDVERTKVFSHLTETEQKDASDELLAVLEGSEKEEVEEPENKKEEDAA